MPKFTGIVIKKEYYRVEVEAEDQDQAKDLMWDVELKDEPVDMDWDIYNVEESQNA